MTQEDLGVAIARIEGRSKPYSQGAVAVRLAATTGRGGQLVAPAGPTSTSRPVGVVFSKGIVDGGPGVGLVERHQDGPVVAVALDPGTVAALRRHGRRRPGNGRSRWGAAAGWCLRVLRRRGVEGAVAARFGVGPLAASPEPGRRSRGAAQDLRHMVATQLLAAGVDVRTVAGRLGHATPTLTMSTYAAWLPERDQAAAGEIGRLLG